jgi:hypothetical protein
MIAGRGVSTAGRACARLVALAAVALSLLALPAEAAETRKVIAGRPGYDASGFHEFWFGKAYRDMWTTPIEVPVLDLRSYAGGLTPVRQVGGLQSLGLAMKGANGRSYTFRALDKDPTKILPEEWRNSWPARIFQDQTVANYPGSAFVIPPLAEAVGVAHTNPEVVFMPDDEALGQFRATFGGKAGTIDEYPTPRAGDYAGFLQATEIISSPQLWERWLKGDVQIDVPAYLRARLFDLFLGDWDRHNSQWRYLRRPDHTAWLPMPEDRDQAFSNFSGVALSMARNTMPRLLKWDDEYSNTKGLFFQGGETDRWFLSGTERSAFEQAAREVQAALTDAVIQAAVKRLPPEWYKIGGEQLTRDLIRRRDLLPAVAKKFYENLARQVDVRGTDQADQVRLERGPEGLLLEIRPESGGEPWFRRRFLEEDTGEIRLYLYGGVDRLVATGPRGGIKVRVSGGGGPDRLDDSASGGTKFYDVDGEGEVVKGAGTSVSDAHWETHPYKPDTLWLEQRDYGGTSMNQTLVWWEPDPGIVLSASKIFVRYGFRKQPYAQLHRVGVDYKVRRSAFRVYYDGDYRWSKPHASTNLELWYDGAENYNFFGFGNETRAVSEDRIDVADDFYEAHQRTTYAFPSFAMTNHTQSLRFRVGPVLKYSSDYSQDPTFLNQSQPYGFGDFGQVGARATIEWDSRFGGPKPPGALLAMTAPPRETGVKVTFDGNVYPKAWDVEETFGSVEGSLAGYWRVAKRLTLAGRVGGKQVWGRYPWYEAAFIGGSPNVRGYDRNRWAGDKSVYANAEARFGLGASGFILPARWGLLALVDTGRVWLEGEDSDTWRPAYGGGLWVRLLTINITFYGAIIKGRDEEKVKVYAGYGFAF